MENVPKNDDIIGRVWDFGDGTTSTEENPVHLFTAPGAYSVTLTLIRKGGLREVHNKTIFIRGSSSPKWVMIWNDEFNQDSVDAGKWRFDIGGWGWGNNELQYYTDGANARVENGLLIITAKKENKGNRNYTSARMKTQGIFEVKYGKIEARISVPMGDGLWPAFWMLGSNIKAVGWPKCGEIDIMEHVNWETQIYGSAHWDYEGHMCLSGPMYNSNPKDFHVYAIEWDPFSIRWYMNGEQYYEVIIQDGAGGTEEFHQPFFIILNLAVGGKWPGPPTNKTVFPAEYKVDYVRVFKLAE